MGDVPNTTSLGRSAHAFGSARDRDRDAVDEFGVDAVDGDGRDHRGSESEAAPRTGTPGVLFEAVPMTTLSPSSSRIS